MRTFLKQWFNGATQKIKNLNANISYLALNVENINSILMLTSFIDQVELKRGIQKKNILEKSS